MDRKRLRDLSWSAIGATAAISGALSLVADEHSPFLLASLGGSTAFLFALTETEAAQPRALFGGHLGGAIIGIAAFQLFGDALWVSAGANPLFMVHNHAGVGVLFNPVCLGVATLFSVACLWSRLRPGRAYPVRWWQA